MLREALIAPNTRYYFSFSENMSGTVGRETQYFEAAGQSIKNIDTKLGIDARFHGRSHHALSVSTCTSVRQVNIVIDFLAKSGANARKAETLLSEMYDVARKTNNSKLLPNTISFNSVLHAWAKSKEQIAATRALALLHRMQELDKSRCEGCQT